MGGKLRVFVSSTIRDLRNERHAVCKRLKEFNYEPVNAEGWVSDGSGIWERIQRELASSDIVVLILGEKYGFEPQKGPMANQGLSVTHLEYREAKRLKKPILRFFQKLDHEDQVGLSDDVKKKRDSFREEVSNWAGGAGVTKYEYAEELANLVGQGINTWLINQTRDRPREAIPLPPIIPTAGRAVLNSVPAELLTEIRNHDTVLLAGAGFQWEAGLPSAAAFSEYLAHFVRQKEPEYLPNPVGSALAGVATDMESSCGRQSLLRAVHDFVRPPRGIVPATSHYKAVKLFRTIITTNYDGLFEEAASASGLAPDVVTREINNDLAECAIVNLHGTANDPGSLVITERDVLLLDQSRPNLWAAMVELLKQKTVVVIGSSLRDPSLVRLVTDVGSELHGYFVSPILWDFTAARVNVWQLQCIKLSADQFFKMIDAFAEAKFP